MTSPSERVGDRNERFWEELAEIERRQPGVRLTGITDATGSPICGCDATSVLVHPDHIDGVRGELGLDPLAAAARRSGGWLRQTVVLGAGETIFDRVASLNRGAAGRAANFAGGDLRAVTTNNLISIAPVTVCPADEPRPVAPYAEIWPPSPADADGKDVKILVIDTGRIHAFDDALGLDPEPPGWHPKPNPDDPRAGLDGYSRQPYEPIGVSLSIIDNGAQQTSIKDLKPISVLKEYAGHGTFIAGILKTRAPKAKVYSSNLLQHAGAMLEEDFGRQLLRVLDEFARQFGDWPHIISLSAGGTSHDGGPMVGLDRFLDELARNHSNTILVAAAGNDGTKYRKFWPAAAAPDNDGIVAVGALRRDHRERACFSNYGSWVTVYAPGEAHVNRYPSGPYAYQHSPHGRCRYYEPPLYRPCGCITGKEYGDLVLFDRRARWSGTSFSTPLVAGMIANFMAKEQRFTREAAWDFICKTSVEGMDSDGVPLKMLL